MRLPTHIFGKLCGLPNNIFSNRKYKLSYVAEGRGWVVNQVGDEIITQLNRFSKIKGRITRSHLGIRNQIVHFGSVHTFLKENGPLRPHKSNRAVMTWFHIVPHYQRNKLIREAQKRLSIVHTACSVTKGGLVDLGVPPEKIVVIPLGIDLSLFSQAPVVERQELKAGLGIPAGSVVIGSFQKDGVGWGQGLEPKLIKGPDIFVRAMERLAKNYPVFVLLVGPSRGYVMKELEKRNIPYKSIGYLKDFREVAKYYKALDLYMITARIEGGPRSILESWASGVPVVATKVGMLHDIALNNQTALLARIEDAEQIASKAEMLLANRDLKEKLIANGLKQVQNHSWQKIAQRYFQEIYSKLV